MDLFPDIWLTDQRCNKCSHTHYYAIPDPLRFYDTISPDCFHRLLLKINKRNEEIMGKFHSIEATKWDRCECFECYVFFFGLWGQRFDFVPPVLVCFAVWKNRHMRTVTNYFIVNLSFADVLVTIICLPASLVVDITETWFFGNTLCKIVPYLQVGHQFCHRTPWPALLYVFIHPSSFIISQFLHHQEIMRMYLEYNDLYLHEAYVRSVTMVLLSLVHVLCSFQSCPLLSIPQSCCTS